MQMQADLGGVSVLKDANVDGCVREAIMKLVREKRKQIESDIDDFRVAIGVSKRQISISVYTMKRHDALPLPLVDKELATAVYDLRLHKYVHGVNIDWLKEHIMELYRLYKLGKFNIAL